MTPHPPSPPAQPQPVHFVEPVAVVQALNTPPSPSPSPALESQPQQPPEGQGHAGDSNAGATTDQDLADDAMGAGEGEGGASRRLSSSLKKTAFSTPALLPTQQPQQPPHHHRHHSDPDGALSRAADDVMLQQQLERQRRLQQIDTSSKVKMVQSAPPPRRGGGGRSISLTTRPNPRPQRWSLGGPLTGTSWDVVLGQPLAHNGGPGPLPTVSLATQRLQHHQGSDCSDSADLFHNHNRHDEHLIRFVYPEHPCPGCNVHDAAVQVSGPPPLQLYVLPEHRCGCRRGRVADGVGVGAGADAGSCGPCRGPCRWLVQAVFCLAGMGFIILVLALAGAAAFHTTEGPHEDLQVHILNKTQNELVIRLATDLRVVSPEDGTWRAVIEKLVEQHEQMVLQAAAAGYGEGGAGEDGARIWTFPGGLLFAASLLTTLGFGAPVPRTPLGRLAAVLLAVLGIPLNVVLALQLGRLISTRLPRLLPVLAPPRTPGPDIGYPRLPPATPSDKDREGRRLRGLCSSCWTAPPAEASSSFRWAPILVPVGALLVYYMLGMILFGSVLRMPVVEWLLFPLSLTAAGGVARVPGWIRVAYAAYLEGGVLLAAAAVALLQAPATTATTDLALRLGILDLDDYYAA